jgi:hypothetical protein
VTVDAPFPGIVAGSAKKVNGPTAAPEAEELAKIQGPVSETVEYCMLCNGGNYIAQVVENDRLIHASWLLTSNGSREADSIWTYRQKRVLALCNSPPLDWSIDAVPGHRLSSINDDRGRQGSNGFWCEDSLEGEVVSEFPHPLPGLVDDGTRCTNASDDRVVLAL